MDHFFSDIFYSFSIHLICDSKELTFDIFSFWLFSFSNFCFGLDWSWAIFPFTRSFFFFTMLPIISPIWLHLNDLKNNSRDKRRIDGIQTWAAWASCNCITSRPLLPQIFYCCPWMNKIKSKCYIYNLKPLKLSRLKRYNKLKLVWFS